MRALRHCRWHTCRHLPVIKRLRGRNFFLHTAHAGLCAKGACECFRGYAGADCSEGATLATLQLRAGYWRSAHNSVAVLQCPDAAILCKDGAVKCPSGCRGGSGYTNSSYDTGRRLSDLSDQGSSGTRHAASPSACPPFASMATTSSPCTRRRARRARGGETHVTMKSLERT